MSISLRAAADGNSGAIQIGGTDRVTIDSSGNLIVGTTSASEHILSKSVTTDAGNLVAKIGNYNVNIAATLQVFAVNGGSVGNAANAGIKLNKDATTSRSINAGGTINASGADYAEYERNNGIKFAKGDIVGFKADGTLTNVFAEAIRFGVKSTDPSYVGGDTWGTEDKVGKRPNQPAEDAEQSVKDQYALDLAEFETKLEEARQLVDRVAYSGKVPVNVLGATPGDYIIATYADGAITGTVVTDPDFAQYKKAVGRVNRILEDGRCEVAVMVH